MEKQLSTTSILNAWLRERGVGFVFFPDEIPVDVIGANNNSVSASLHRLLKEDRVSRIPARNSSMNSSFRYTVLEKINEKREETVRPKAHTKPRIGAGEREAVIVAPKEKTVAELIDTAFNALIDLQRIASKPLSQHTNAELIAELHKRSSADLGVVAVDTVKK